MNEKILRPVGILKIDLIFTSTTTTSIKKRKKMSQRVDKGPKFKPSVPVRRPGAGAASTSTPTSSSSQLSTAHAGEGQPGSSQESARQTEGGSQSRSQAPPSNESGPSSSQTQTRIGPPTGIAAIRPPTQITAAGLRLTPRRTTFTPGSQQSSQPEQRPPASIPTPPASGQARAAPIRVGRPPQPTPSTEASQGGEASNDEEEDPEDALVRNALREGGPIEDEDQGDENGESSTTRSKRGKKPPRAKRLTVDEEEAAYEEQITQEGATLDESRPAPEDISMSALARYEVRAGKASKRTFDMMRKHEVHKEDLKKERKELEDMLVRKRKAGKDWLEKFGSEEEEAAEDEKRRSLRRKAKKDRRKDRGDDGEEDGDEQDDEDGDDAELEGEAAPDTVARILDNEVGDNDSDDGNSMTSEEGSDLDAPLTARQKKGKEKQAAPPPVPPKRGRSKGKNQAAASAPQDSSSSGSDSEDDVYGESNAAVQIRLGPDGRPVLSESSLTVDPSQMTDVIDAGVEGVTSVIETERFINSSTRGKKSINSRWSKDETEKFFRAISQWGTDFEMIARLFPTRSRHQIKLKFSREEKLDPARINLAFKTRIPVDLEAYGAAVGRNLSGPPPKVSVKKPDDYLKMEEQERLLRGGGEGEDSAIGVRAETSSSRRTDRASSTADRRGPAAASAVVGTEAEEEDAGGAAASGEDAPASSSARRRSITPSSGRRRSGSNAGATSSATGSGSLARSTQRRGGYDRERDRERAKAIAEEQRRERERLHRAGSGRGGGGVAYESQEMVLGDADD
ncbi:hypothetical protein A4X13_0g614 [Tilletia indica]|uniref:Uncharacterized protein n=1 Tax=Tilletia indica TaxID=43049 RepID=A0A177TXF0_9BASI|nr:hypothetical protein A4X13_0g614 [Tilletia indica]